MSPSLKTEIITLGCRLNAYESERMGALANAGGIKNMTIVNSCAVTQEAVRQTRQAIRRAKRKHPQNKIVVTGCAAQIEPHRFRHMKEVDSVLDNSDKLSSNFFGARGKTWLKQSRTRAMLKIQNGCDWHCTFCIIPQTRGPSRSRLMEEIIDEARFLFSAGHTQISLTGVDIASYGKDLSSKTRLGDLVEGLLKHTPSGLKFHLSSLDPAAFDDKLVELLCVEARLLPYIHFSAQAGDNMILKRMRRRHSREQMITLCEYFKKRREFSFGADLIAGFPTESETMFRNSLALIDDCDISFAHIFPFSARLGTAAARMKQLAQSLVRHRAKLLRQRAEARLHHFLSTKLGKQESVLAETEQTGRTNFYAAVYFKKSCERGKNYMMKMIARQGNRLIAEPVRVLD